MKFVFAVTSLMPTKSAFVWWPCEFDVPKLQGGREPTEDQALDWINSVLIEDGSIRCLKFELEWPAQPERVVKKKVPLILGRGMVGVITTMHFELIEPTGEREAA